jgi:hypothetical protein
MSDHSTDGAERDGDLLEEEAETLVEIFNEAAPDYSPDLRWFGMDLDHETKEERFVLEAESYIDSDGLVALRECGRIVQYIEAHELDGDVIVQISLPVQDEIPDRTLNTGGESDVRN